VLDIYRLSTRSRLPRDLGLDLYDDFDFHNDIVCPLLFSQLVYKDKSRHLSLLEVIIHRPLKLGVQVHERVRVLSEDVRETDALRTEKQGVFVYVNAESRILSHDVLLRLTAIPLTGSNQYCVFAAPSQHPDPAFLPYFESRKFKHSPTLCPTSSKV
jgi:hypothetical protein